MRFVTAMQQASLAKLTLLIAFIKIIELLTSFERKVSNKNLVQLLVILAFLAGSQVCLLFLKTVTITPRASWVALAALFVYLTLLFLI